MSTRNISLLVLLFVLLSLLVQVGRSSEPVVVQFLYWDPTTDVEHYCSTCPDWVRLYQDFLKKNQTMTRVQADYAQVSFEWIEFYSDNGTALSQSTNVKSPNSLIINGVHTIEGSFDEAYLRRVLDAALLGLPLPEQDKPLLPLLSLAFVFGFLETFSPCLLALLSFLLSFTLGETSGFKKNFSQVMTFGAGFVIAAVSLGLAVGSMFMQLQAYRTALMWIVSVFAILFGLSMLGIFKSSVETKPIVQRLARKYAFTLGGLLLLGFLFYFLDPCIAPVFVTMLPILSPQVLTITMLMFSIGVMIPFLAIAFLAGSISKLVRTTYKHKSLIRAFSGLILIGYAIYIILFYLL